MKALGFPGKPSGLPDNRLARPFPAVAAPLEQNALAPSAKAVPQWRELRLPPWVARLDLGRDRRGAVRTRRPMGLA